jgi:hypothetical protein
MGNASATSTMALSSVDQSHLSSNLYQTSSIQQVISTPALKLNSTNTSANTVEIGNATGTTSITVNKPLTPGYTIQPVVGQIGYFYTAIPTTTVQTAFATNSNLFEPILIPAGTWLIQYSYELVNLSGSTVLTKYSTEIATNGSIALAVGREGCPLVSAYTINSTNTLIGNASLIIYNTVARNIKVVITTAGSSFSGALTFVAGEGYNTYTRIA